MNKISPIQLFWFYVQAQVGVGLLTLPNDVNLDGHADGWIAILLAGVFIQVVIMLYWYIHICYPSLSYFKILENVFGKFLGKIVTCSYIIYFYLTAAMVMISYISILQKWTNPLTPKIVLSSIFTIICLYALMSSLRVIASFMTAITPLIFIAILGASYGYTGSETLHMLPILQSDWHLLGKGIFLTTLALDGFIVLLVLYPSVNASFKTKLLASTYANFFVIFLYTFLAISAYSYHGPGLLHLLEQPFLYLIRTISIIVIERVDLVFLALWTIVVLATIIIYLFMARVAIQNVHYKLDNKFVLIILGLGLSLGTPIPTNNFAKGDITDFVEKTGIIFLFIIPLLTAALIIFKKLLKKEHYKTFDKSLSD